MKSICAAATVLGIADAYWASHLGCALEVFQQPGMRVQQHGGELVGYHGVFAIFRERGASISIPPCLSLSSCEALRSLPPEAQPADVAAAVAPLAGRVIGPAFIGYTDRLRVASFGARLLAAADAPAIERLREACGAEEWEHGGSEPKYEICAGVFVDDELVALAGFEIWGSAIAHISVISHPRHRGRGWGREAVARVAEHALQSGLLAQYRTLCANLPSMRIARKLGFQPYAVSIAIRLSHDAPTPS